MLAPLRRLSPLALLCLAGVLLAGTGIANHDLWSPDEPRVAGIGVEMWRSGSWAVPTLGGAPFLEKPPLYWWCQSLAYRLLGGASAGAARLPSAFFGLATLLLTYAWGRSFLGRPASLLAALVVATTAFFVRWTHWALVDPALLAGTTGSLACFSWACRVPTERRGPWLAGLLGFLVLAFFSKGPIGLILPGLAATAHGISRRQLRSFLDWRTALAAGVGAALVALWLWRVEQGVGSQRLWAALLRNGPGRFLPGLGPYHGAHQRPLLYYLSQTSGDLLPWTPLMALALFDLRRRWRELTARERDGLHLCLAMALGCLLLLSLAGTKRGIYMLPVLPPLALLLGWWMTDPAGLARLESLPVRLWRGVLGLLALLLPACVGALDLSRWGQAAAGVLGVALLGWLLPRIPAALFGLPWLRTSLLLGAGWLAFLSTVPPARNPSQSRRPVLEELNRQLPAGAPVYLFRASETTLGLLSFYTRHPARVLEQPEQLRALARRRRPSWLLLEGRQEGGGDYAAFRALGVPHVLRLSRRTPHGNLLVLVELGGGLLPGKAPASAEEGARQSLPVGLGEGVLRAQQLEAVEHGPAGGPVGEARVLLDHRQQLLQGLFVAPCGGQAPAQLQPRAQVRGVCGHLGTAGLQVSGRLGGGPGAQLRRQPLGLLLELRRARGEPLQQGQGLAGRVPLAQHTGQPQQGLGVARLLRKGRAEALLGGVRMAALPQGSPLLRQAIGLAGDQGPHPLPDHPLRLGPQQLGDHAAPAEAQQQGNAAHLVVGSRLGRRIHVQPGQQHGPLLVLDHSLQDRAQGPTGAAPGGPEVHDDRLPVGALEDALLEVGISDVDHDLGIAGRGPLPQRGGGPGHGGLGSSSGDRMPMAAASGLSARRRPAAAGARRTRTSR